MKINYRACISAVIFTCVLFITGCTPSPIPGSSHYMPVDIIDISQAYNSSPEPYETTRDGVEILKRIPDYKIKIPVGNYIKGTKWESKLGYEPSGSFYPYVFGSGSGRFLYPFKLDENPKSFFKATVSARLSSAYMDSKNRSQSDVTLLLNNNKYLTKRVVAFNELGMVYTWDLKVKDLVKGTNKIEFRVSGNSALKNGLSIYQITVQLWKPIKVRPSR